MNNPRIERDGSNRGSVPLHLVIPLFVALLIVIFELWIHQPLSITSLPTPLLAEIALVAIIAPFLLSLMILFIERSVGGKAKTRTPSELETQIELTFLAALTSISKMLSAFPTPEELLDYVLDKMLEATGLKEGAIFLLEQDSHELRLISERTPFRSPTRVMGSPEERETVVAEVAQSGQQVVLENLPPQARGERDTPPPWTCMAAIPLRSREGLLGVVFIASHIQRTLPPHAIQLINAFADHIAVAIDNLQMYQEIIHNRNQLAALSRTSLDIMTQLELPTLLPAIVKGAVSLLNSKGGAMHLVTKPGKELKCLVNLSTPIQKGTVIPFGEGVIGTVAASGRPMFLQGNEPEKVGMKPPSAVLAVPMKWREQVSGVLHVQDDPGEKVFTPEDLSLLALLANQAAVVMENARLYEESKYLAITDTLSGLYNRRYFAQALENELTRSQRHGHNFSIVVFDVDLFKNYNDGYGHLAGDELLKGLAAIIRETTRQSDIAARYGGDEFAIILPETIAERARQVAEKLRQAVADRSFPYGRVTISIGMASYPKDSLGAEDLLEIADRRLYVAKERGRNNICTGDEKAGIHLAQS